MKTFLKKGNFVDARSAQGSWCAGVVIELDEDNVKVRLDGYGVKSDIV